MELSQILIQHRMSQRKLATATGYSPAVINQLIKHGKYPRSIPPSEVQATIEQALQTLDVNTAINWQQPQTQTINQSNEQELAMQTQKINLQRQTLQLFNLARSPFDRDVQCRDDVYISEEQSYIRQNMLYTAKHADFMAIVGESGSGKSTLKEDLIEAIKQDKENITIIHVESKDINKLTVASLCDAIIDDVSNGTVKAKRGIEAKSRQIRRLLTDSSRAGYKHCLIIDEAQDLTVPMLKYLKRFWEVKDGMTHLLGILLIGHPELRDKLSPSNRDLREVVGRCSVVELQPLNAYVGEYLQHKFARVGKDINEVFADDAISGLTAQLSRNNGLSTVSHLYPLAVNNAVANAMNACAEIGQTQITADIFF